MKYFSIIGLLLFVVQCQTAPARLYNVDRSGGTVTSIYHKGSLQTPNKPEAFLPQAQRLCQEWGYEDAQYMASKEECKTRDQYGFCTSADIISNYRCTGGAKIVNTQ
jgi:hypothetical protein